MQKNDQPHVCARWWLARGAASQDTRHGYNNGSKHMQIQHLQCLYISHACECNCVYSFLAGSFALMPWEIQWLPHCCTFDSVFNVTTAKSAARFWQSGQKGWQWLAVERIPGLVKFKHESWQRTVIVRTGFCLLIFNIFQPYSLGETPLWWNTLHGSKMSMIKPSFCE